MRTDLHVTINIDDTGNGTPIRPYRPLGYRDLRALAEYASGVRAGDQKDPTVWLAVFENGRIEVVDPENPPPGVILIVPTKVGDAAGNRINTDYAWIGPNKDNAVDLLDFDFDGRSRSGDSVFWTQSAVEKFLVPYYASVEGGHAAPKVDAVLGLLGSIRFRRIRKGGTSEQDTTPYTVFALVHLPQSEYVTPEPGLDSLLPTDLAVGLRPRDVSGRCVVVHALDLV